MSEDYSDTGVIQVVVERFQNQRLPRALAIKDQVDRGERLNESDIAFLEEVLRDSARVKPYVDAHPEWQDLVGRALHLYSEITAKALENERTASR